MTTIADLISTIQSIILDSKLQVKEGIIVTRSDDEILTLPDGTITVISAWNYLLRLSSH